MTFSPIKSDSSPSICHFVAELMQRTMDNPDELAYQRALQAFVEEQKPWMPPVKGTLRKHAPLFSKLELDEDSGQVSATFTPEGLACFQG